jgi:hydroxyacylglutathione hydrolase
VYFRRLYDEQLAQASYLIGCQATGEAIVVDPSRLVDQYVSVAAAEDLRIVAVTETHIHADFASGSRELAAATGARLFVSGCGTPDWQYDFRGEPTVTVLRDRDPIEIGHVLLQAIHTPGHTPEHLSFLVTDRAGASEPIGILTGDFVFVGDVGRPDLLERAAGIANTAIAGARTLYQSLAWFKTLPDHLQIWPGHGAGSACGKGLGAMPQSTVGYERRFNWAFRPVDEAEFVRQVLVGQPDPPQYFGRMKQLNRAGPPILGRLPAPPRLPDEALAELLGRKAIVVDLRPTGEFAEGHIPGTINLPMGRSFPTYAGSLLPYDRELHFLTTARAPIDLVVANLVTIGLDRVAGYFEPSARAAWEARGGGLGRVRQTSVAELARQVSNGVHLIDVRNRSEWEGGHLPGATLVPLAELDARLDEIPKDREIVIHCQTGSRSSIAASVLLANGWSRVSSLTGGFSAWVAAGNKISTSL